MEPRYELTYTTDDGEECTILVAGYGVYSRSDGCHIGFLLPSGERRHVRIQSYSGHTLDKFKARKNYSWGKTGRLHAMSAGEVMTVPFVSVSNYNSWSSIARRQEMDSVNPLTGETECGWDVRARSKDGVIIIKRIK